MTYVEIDVGDCYVLAVEGSVQLESWLQEGFKRLGRYERLGAFADAMRAVPLEKLEPLWRELVGGPIPDNEARRVVDNRLEEETDGDYPRLLILTRLLERNLILEMPVYKPREAVGPQRLSTDHYVVIETVDEQGHAVPSIPCELVIAGGEVRTVNTGPEGVVRVDRIQAGRVIIRVVGLDGSMWRPAAGEAAQVSGADGRPRIHVVSQGECLSKIAHRYGIKDWKTVWDDPKNEKLRKKRKSPHVLHPGDQVAVPGTKVHEIVRSTDQTHRIEVKANAEIELDVVLEGLAGEPLAGYACVLRPDAGPFANVGARLQLDDDGRLRTNVPVQARRVDIELEELGETITLSLGALNPALDGETGGG